MMTRKLEFALLAFAASLPMGFGGCSQSTVEAPQASQPESMPDKIVNADEQKLYLTPGGKYTVADIKANGNVTASVKFQGFMSAHDMHPKAGDKICPVTMTKANPKCTWIVDGKAYEFCCPPCVDEFVKLAKETPDEIKEPGEYVKQ